MIKRYSIPTEQIAKDLILTLAPLDTENHIVWNKLTVTEFTHAIVCLGFQDKYLYNEETQESELISKGMTYDVDIFWKDEPLDAFKEFEVEPVTPNHKFA